MEEEKASAPKPESGWKRRLRVTGWIVGGMLAFLVLVVGIALAAVNTRSGHDWVRRKILAQAHQVVPGLDIGALQGFLPFHATVSGIALRDLDGQPVASVDRVFVDLALWPLLSKTIALAQLRIERPSLVITPAGGGRGGYNLQHIQLPRQKPQKPLSFAVRVLDLRLEGGGLAFLPGT